EQHDGHGHVVFRAALRAGVRIAADAAQAAGNAANNHRQGLEHANDPGGGHAAGADEQQVVVADLADRHLLDGLVAGRNDTGGVFADEGDDRDDDEVAEDRPGHHHGAGPQPDDIADAEQFGRHGLRE